MAILLLCFLLSLQRDVGSTCEQLCPSDKPYCSDVGCIFECPEPFYINSSNCVSHCGDWFVDENRNCVESCPNNTFYEEKLKQVQSGQYLERKCVVCNNYNQFVFSESCVKVCPADSRCIDRNNCVNKCPADKPFKTNTTLFDLLHYKCVDKCPKLVDDNFCSDDCQNNKVIFNSSCIGQCPSSSPFLFSKSCLTECPKNAPSAGNENKTCLKDRCPDEKSYVVNNTCVERCPETEPLVSSTFHGDSGFNICVENCEVTQYMFDGHCVGICPSLTVAFNGSCLEQCPIDEPFSCVISRGLACGERPHKNITYTICVNHCPSTMFIWNQTCVFFCPNGIPVLGNKCVDKCSLDYPFQINITTTKNCDNYKCLELEMVLTCVKDCPTDYYIFDKTCLLYCPSPLFYEDNRCESDCSATKPFILNTKLALNIWSNDNKYWFHRAYVQVNKEVAIQKCTPSCDGMVILNSTCVNSCPNDNIFIHNGTCSQQECIKQYTESTRFGKVCLDECKTHQLVLNETCVETCPDTYKKFNGTCVAHCPESHMYTVISVQGKVCDYYEGCYAKSLIKNCVEKCPDTFFEYNNTCVNFCQIPLFTLNNECVESCPIGSPYYSDTSSVTVESWNFDGYRFRKTDSVESIVKCIAACTEGKVVLGFKCIDSCPENLPFIRNETCGSKNCTENYKYFSSPGIKCLDECPKDLYVINDTCILQCPEDLFVIGQSCVTNCPATHGLIHEATIAKQIYNCTGYTMKDYTCASSVNRFKKCQNRCPENKFLFNSTCIDHCLKNTYVFNTTCVETCPISHPFSQYTTTTAKVWTHFLDGLYLKTMNYQVKKCVERCTDLFQFENDCIESCPETAPFVV